MEPEKRYIYEIWREGSFSRAAEKLYLSQSALSMAVSKVEKGLGMPIFDRSRRPPLLTPAGEIYLDAVERAIHLEEDMERQISDIREIKAGKLCIGGSHYLNAYILPDVLTQFHRIYPRVSLELVENSSSELAKMLGRQELDLTFSCNEEFMLDFKRYPAFLDHILLGVPDMFVREDLKVQGLKAAQVSAGRHLESSCPSISLAELYDVDFILLSAGNNLHDRARQLFEESGIHPNILMEVSQLVTAYHLADHGLGATFVSDRLIFPGVDRLLYFKLDSKLTERLFYMLLPNRNYIPNAVRAFIDHVQKTL